MSQTTHKLAAILMALDPAELEIPRDFGLVAIEAHKEDNAESPEYIKYRALVTKKLNNALAAKDITIEESLLNIAVESFLENTNLSAANAATLQSRDPLPASKFSIGEEFSAPAVENFDNSVPVDLAPINATYNVYKAVGNPYVKQINKVFPVQPIGNKSGYQVVIDKPFAHHNSFHLNGVPKDFDNTNIMDLLDTRHEFGSLRIYPVVGECDENLLTDVAKIAPWEVLTMDEKKHETAPIKFNKSIDLKGAAQLAIAKQQGEGYTMDDELSPSMSVDSIWADFGGDIIEFNISGRGSAAFDPSRQGSANDLTLSMAEEYVITPATVTIAGVPQTNIVLPADHRAVVRILVSGGANIRTAKTRLSLEGIELVRVIDAGGNIVASDATIYTDIQANLDTCLDPAAENGYMPDVRLQNSNLYQLGPVLDFDAQTENYYAVTGNPVSVSFPVNRAKAVNSLSYLSSYNATMRARSGLQLLESFAKELNQLTAGGTISSVNAPAGVGAGRHFLRTTFIKDSIDYLTDLNSISHKDREEDHASLLITRINDMVNRLYVEAQYGRGIEGLPAGQSTRPIITLTTSTEYATILEKYKSRFDASFDWKVADLPVSALTEKVYITVNFTSSGYHLLNFGITTEGKENVYATNTTRSRSTKQVIVSHPTATQHINAPAMGLLTFTNRSEALGKICCV